MTETNRENLTLEDYENKFFIQRKIKSKFKYFHLIELHLFFLFLL